MKPMKFSLVALALLLIAVPALAEGLLTPMGPIAADQQVHMIRVTAITMIAVLPVLIGVPLILWRYRRGKQGTYSPYFEFSAPLEIAMWGIPVLIIIVLSYWLWHSTRTLDPYRPLGPDPIEVQVIGLDWKWLFLYPKEGVASIGAMPIPVGRPVQMRLTTDTVMQSFMVPKLAGQIYVMPGMITNLNFQADQLGTANGLNTQYNGSGFASQHFTLEALSPEDWQAWMAAARNGPVLDQQTYAELAKRGTLDQARPIFGVSDGPLRLRLADGQLFQHIVHRYHQGKALPATEQPGAPTYRAEIKP